MIGPSNIIDDNSDEPRTFAGGELLRLQVRSGDKFVLMFPDQLSKEKLNRIAAMWKEFIGDDKAQVLILDGGARLGVFNDGDTK